MTNHMVPLYLYNNQKVGMVEVETHHTQCVVFTPELMSSEMRAALLPDIPDDWTGITKRTDYECQTCGSKAWVRFTIRPNPKSIPCSILSCDGTCVPKVCGKDMGGVWLPDRFGIEVFVPLKCNDYSGVEEAWNAGIAKRGNTTYRCQVQQAGSGTCTWPTCGCGDA